MKVILEFALKNRILPLDYRRAFISFFKKSLSSVANGQYYEKYYFNTGRRPFTFAVKFSCSVFTKESIELNNNKVRLTLSTGDKLTYFVFTSAFLSQLNKDFPLHGGNKMTLTAVRRKDDASVNGNSALVKMISPLCVREHKEDGNKDYYYSVEKEGFADKAKEIIAEQLLSEGFSKSLTEDVEIIPINAKKTVVYHYSTYIECSIGDFVINADKSIINYFLKYGIGSRKSAGFGFAELITE